jgi:hypothetical protein
MCTYAVVTVGGSWSDNWLVLGHLVYGLIDAFLFRLAGHDADLVESLAQ